MRWLKEHRVEVLCYGPLIIAGVLMLVANYAWAGVSLKDELPNPYGISEPVKRSRGGRVPFPERGYTNPERDAFMAVPPSPGASAQRRALVRCASYYAIAQRTMEGVAPEEAADFQKRGIAALGKAQQLGQPAGGYMAEMEEVFRLVFQEYIEAVDGKGVQLFDRYNEACDNLTDDLVEK